MRSHFGDRINHATIYSFNTHCLLCLVINFISAHAKLHFLKAKLCETMNTFQLLMVADKMIIPNAQCYCFYQILDSDRSQTKNFIVLCTPFNTRTMDANNTIYCAVVSRLKRRTLQLNHYLLQPCVLISKPVAPTYIEQCMSDMAMHSKHFHSFNDK